LRFADPAASQGAPRWQYFLNPWWSDKHVFFTRLGADECRRVINEATTRLRAGEVHRAVFSSADFTLYRPSPFRNSMRPFAYVGLREVLGQGTLVTVTMTASRSVKAFSGFWFGFLVVWTLLATGLIIGHHQADLSPLPFGAGLALFGWLFTLVGRVASSGDRAFLTRFLTEELGLTDPPLGTMPIA
jgi:hypothetical protein